VNKINEAKRRIHIFLDLFIYRLKGDFEEEITQPYPLKGSNGITKRN
jgi:hypothetical protein